jgi:hypothetical protein
LPVEIVYTDACHELWSEGVAILESLGESNDRARRMIGRWRKDTGHDDVRIYEAIKRAREVRTRDPIAFVTGALKVDSSQRTAKPDPVMEGLRRHYDRMFGDDVAEAA